MSAQEDDSFGAVVADPSNGDQDGVPRESDSSQDREGDDVPLDQNEEFTRVLERLEESNAPRGMASTSSNTYRGFKRLSNKSSHEDIAKKSALEPASELTPEVAEPAEMELEENDVGGDDNEEQEDNSQGRIRVDVTAQMEDVDNLISPVDGRNGRSPRIGGRSDSPSGWSIPDDTPSIRGGGGRSGSALSSPANSVIMKPSTPTAMSPSAISPSPGALRPFDRRFQSRIASSPSLSPRPTSPAFIATHSRSSSLRSLPDDIEIEGEATAPWDVVRWTKLKKINTQIFSESGRRSFGTVTCINVSASIACGTTKGLILIFDYHQTLKSIIGHNTKAVESGPITTLAISADYTTVAGGHAKGDIFTWELSKPTKPFLHIQPIPLSQSENEKRDGHVEGASVLHLGFLGTRHTALVSADDKGMAFSHLASRSLVGRVVKTTRILGRYPFDIATNTRPRKPSSVLGFAPLPLGNLPQVTDSMGLVAMLTPYLLVIVSTTPIAQTQHKVARPKEVANDAALSGCLAWFPAIRLKPDASTPGAASQTMKARLAYCWANVLTVLEVSHIEPTDPADQNRPPMLSFKAKRRWKCEEAIVAVQWLNRQILAVLTVSQRLLIIEEPDLRLSEKFDLLSQNIYRHDFYSRQLRSLVGRMDEEASMHATVADAYYNSFKTFKGRMFLLGFDGCAVGTLSNWADRLLAMMEVGDFIGAIHLATDYYNGEIDKITVGLPENDGVRHALVQERLIDMMSASLRYAFGVTSKSAPPTTKEQLQELASACFGACLSMNNVDFLFDVAFDSFEEGKAAGIFLETLEPHVLERRIKSVPPIVLKSLISHFTDLELESRLEEILCHLDPETMDIHQVTTLCKQHGLYDALIYVWNRALRDYITPLIELLTLLKPGSSENGAHIEGEENNIQAMQSVSALKIFPYLSYTLTGRVYPTGDAMDPDVAIEAKAEIYYFLFLGRPISWPKQGGAPFLTKSTDEALEPTFPYLRLILEFDAPSFLSAMNEAFEDAFLNGTPADGPTTNGAQLELGEDQIFGRSVNRQYIVSILTEVMNKDDFSPDETVYLDMFIARNLPKYPQYLLLSGSALHRVLLGLSEFPGDEIADDRELSVEYLLSVYHPPDTDELVQICTKAKFYRVLKSLFKSERRYPQLIEMYFEDSHSREAVFECIADCLRPGAGLGGRQLEDVKKVIRRHAAELVEINVTRTANTIDAFVPELHEHVLHSIESEKQKQFIYLECLMEPQTGKASHGSNKRQQKAKREQEFVELYIRLMCEFNSLHVSDYIEGIRTVDINLPKVLPAMEQSGVMDAVVRLMAREGQIRQAMDKLVNHLATLESALVGLLQASLDDGNLDGNILQLNETLRSLQKFSNVGIWLCQGQMKSASASAKARAQHSSRSMRSWKKSGKKEMAMTFEEILWLDLIDTDVRIAKNASAILRSFPKGIASPTSLNEFDFDRVSTRSIPTTPTTPSSFISGVSHSSRRRKRDEQGVVLQVRRLVQDVFTALLTSTSSSSMGPSVSFLQVLRAFLTKAALSSPSLADLRNVLAGVFDAYVYEEQLLSLANRLLDNDLFVQVKDSAELRLKGWRPRRQACECCEQKVWGVGAAGGIYRAWEARRNEEQLALRLQKQLGTNHGTDMDKMSMRSEKARGKSRAFSIDYDDVGGSKPSSSLGRRSSRDDQVIEEEDDDEDGDGNGGADGSGDRRDSKIDAKEEEEEEDSGEVLVFSCRHVFHRRCLEKKMREAEAAIMARRAELDAENGGGMNGERGLMSPLALAPEDAILESRIFEFSCTVCHPNQRMLLS